MAHPIMRPHTEQSRGSPLFSGGSQIFKPPPVFRAGPPHNTAPETGGVWGSNRPSGSDWSVRSMDGCIVRTGYRTDNMAEERFFPVVTHGTAVRKAFSFPETATVQKHIAATLEKKKQGSASPYNVIIFTLYCDLSR